MEAVAPRADQKARVLVVDDEAVICDVLRDYLQYEGFHVDAAGNGEKAVELLRHEPFDVVLTDLKMPGIDGLDLLQRICDGGSDTVTIMMTGFGTVETAIEAMKRGAFDYILKPFKPEEVAEVLRRALEKQRLQRENIELREAMGFYELSEALSGTLPLQEQLDMIVTMVRDNFGADTATLVTEDQQRPGRYLPRASTGPHTMVLRTERIVQSFLTGERIAAHGPEVERWLDAPSTATHIFSAFMAGALRMRGAPFGVLAAASTRPGRRFTEGQRKGLSVLASRAAYAIETARMYGNLRDTFTQTIEGFARALEAKDTYTHGHSDRVATYARLIAEAMHLPEEDVVRIQHGGLMHDIGKIGIRSGDLNKPQKLTQAEYLMFKSHPNVGRRIIEPISFLAHLVPCVYHHHESYDGSGYPEGLDGALIPLEARILAVADSYDAMTSNRPYRKALPHEIAIAELKRCGGRQFDPLCVHAFLDAIGPWRAARQAQGLPVPQ